MSATALFVISLVAAAASFVYSLVASQQAKNAVLEVGSEDGLTLGDINVTQQSEGLVVPIAYGLNYICGNTIWWYAEKFGTSPNEQYRVCIWQTVCMGKLQSDWSLMPSVDSKYVAFGPAIYPNPATYWWERFQKSFGHNDFGIPNPNVGPPADYLQYFPNNGAYATRLKGVAHVFIKFFELPIGVTNIPTFKYWTIKLLETGLPYENGHWSGSLTFGNNPAAIIYDLLTNEQYGLGIDNSDINWDSFVAASNYFYEQYYELNFVINQSMPVRDIIIKIQDWVECFLIKDENDEYTLVYFQDSDADNPAATVTDNDIISFILSRKSWEDTFNSFTANYTNRYMPGSFVPSMMEMKTATIKNEANISMTGSVRNKVIDLMAFTNLDGVRNRLNKIMKKESYPFASGTLTVNLKYSFLRRGDVITIDTDEYNFIGPFRILDININEIDKNQIDFELVQLRELIADDIVDPANRSEGVYGEASQVRCVASLSLPPNSNITNSFTTYIKEPSTLIVVWAAGQTLKGPLIYGTEFTITSTIMYGLPFYSIVLDPVIFAEEIMMNTLGLLSIDVFESGCPFPPGES